MTTFKATDESNSSHKMGDAAASEDRLIDLLGHGETDGDKSDRFWEGIMTANDGTEVQASAWDWKGGMRAGAGVSIWVGNEKYLKEWKNFLETAKIPR
jgi:hypothetical protein